MEHQKNIAQDAARIRRVTMWGAVVNVMLAVVKIISGMLSGSVALVADGVHSFSDLLTDVIVVVGVYVSDLPPDKTHPYGHGKFETFASIVVAVALGLVGVGIAWDAGTSLYNREESFPGPVVLVVALISIVAKEVLFQVTRKVAQQTDRPSVLANAWHHRSDALSSVAVFLGGVAGMFGWGHGDQVAGIVVGAMVAAVAVKLFSDNVQELSEHAVSDETLSKVQNCLERHEDVKGWHRLRSRKVGREVFMDVHIFLQPDMTVAQGHDIADTLEDEIRRVLGTPANITIHMEPYTPQRAARNGIV